MNNSDSLSKYLDDTRPKSKSTTGLNQYLGQNNQSESATGLSRYIENWKGVGNAEESR